MSKEEHVDNEFLWNLKLLSEVTIIMYRYMDVIGIVIS